MISPLDTLPLEVSQSVLALAELFKKAGGRALLVGGCTRDALLLQLTVDVDLEVYGLTANQIEATLKPHFRYEAVGRAFGVLKIKGQPIDVTLPRRESKVGLGHQAFTIEGDPFMTFEEAASRRDFTINAIGYDPLTHAWLDPYNGKKDLENRCLRHVSQAFSEDPLRVLRAMQMIARFQLQIHPSTLSLCQTITPEGLSRERLFEEWKKLILKGKKPSLGLQFLKDCKWIQYYPELNALVDCQQDPVWHPEGDVWTHTTYCMDAFAQARVGDDWEDLVVGFATLCHDLGKPLTTQQVLDGRIRSPGHDVAGEGPTCAFLSRLTQHQDLIEAVIPLVLCHMRPVELYKAQASDSAVRRLAAKVGRIDRLIRVVHADKGGRPPLPLSDGIECKWLQDRAIALSIENQKPQPILLGRHLIEHGLKPGPHFKSILDAAYEAQLDGLFHDLEGALYYLEQTIQGNQIS